MSSSTSSMDSAQSTLETGIVHGRRRGKARLYARPGFWWALCLGLIVAGTCVTLPMCIAAQR